MSNHQHILLYTDDPGIYGVGQYNHALLHRLHQDGHQVTCVQTEQQNPLIEHRVGLGIHHEWLKFDSTQDFSRTLSNTQDAEEIFERLAPDLVIFSNCCPLSNFAAKQVAVKLGIDFVVIEGFVAPYLAERFAALLPELASHYTHAKATIAVSQDNLALLRQLFGLSSSKGRVVHYGRPDCYFSAPNPSTRDAVRQAFDIPPEAIVCLTAARLEPVKGYQYQLAAIERLQQSPVWPQLYFVWAGDGSLEGFLKERTQALGCAEQIRFIGKCSNIPEWLEAADIFILPSELEGMPLAIMEAMAKGLPVIASAVSGIPEELADTGALLPDPKANPEATVNQLVKTLLAWTEDAQLRSSIGSGCRARATLMFREEYMLERTMKVIHQSLITSGDYVAPGLELIRPDDCFPNMTVGDVKGCGWPYLRKEIPHNWYVDRRQPTVGFLSRDEAHILYNTALQFKGENALEIGCWMGWSACHLALAGVALDVVDPLLERPDFYESVSGSLRAAGCLDAVNLVPGYSPERVVAISEGKRQWSLIFIDGNHDAPGPLNDAIACEQYAASDAIILFHDLASPEVSEGLDYLRDRGWHTMVYQTMQIMGVAWRGNVQPIEHQPDPTVNWILPDHLQGYRVSGLSQSAADSPTAATVAQSSVEHESASLLARVKTLLERHKKNSQDVSCIESLLDIRREMARSLLETSNDLLRDTYRSGLGEVHALLIKSGLSYYPTNEHDDELIGIATDAMLEGLDRPTSLQSLLVIMLFKSAHSLPLQAELAAIPDWLLHDYLEYLTQPPMMFVHIGEADAYFNFFQALMTGIEMFASENKTSWDSVSARVSSRLNMMPLYFSNANLKEVYQQRANLLESALIAKGYFVDYEFPARSPQASKIKLGILAAHFEPLTETFTTLPFYKHLSRDVFEINLFSLQSGHHRLTRYCSGHADELFVLPKDLSEQVNFIRAQDLDILLIGTNVTAVTNSISLLALHRLARIQIASTSSCTTTGMKHIDYYISGKLTEDLISAQQQYHEKLLLIEGPAHCHDVATEAGLIKTISLSREDLKLSSDTVVFASGANFFKIIPEVMETWAKIIAAVPNAKLILYPFNANWSPVYPQFAFQVQLTKVFNRHGLGADDFMILGPVPNRADVKERLKLADVYLDSFPFAGINSLIDPLELGLPVVAMDGQAFRSKMGVALLKDIDITELIVENEAAYLALAVNLGTDHHLRAQVSAKINQRMQQATPRFLDSRSYGCQVQSLLQSIFQDFQDYSHQYLKDKYRLSDVNFMVCPNWDQSEDSIIADLANSIKGITRYTQARDVALVIDTQGLDEEVVNLYVSSAVMYLLMDDGFETDHEPNIVLLGHLDAPERQALTAFIQARIVLEHAGQQGLDWSLPVVALRQLVEV
jgi:predicted O-linked N-acetylglucosamine transferase (SPINDLY family)/glycosyltransferase involved in cell wall biosynthesis